MRHALERGAGALGRPGGVLRSQHARCRLHRRTVRPACPAVRACRARQQRARRGVFEGEVRGRRTSLCRPTAEQPGARAWYVLDDDPLDQPVRDRKVADLVAVAPTRVDPAELPFPAPPGARAGGSRLARDHAHDRWAPHRRASAGRRHGRLFAAGADVGGISTGGYASGLVGRARLRPDCRRERSRPLVANS